MKGKSQRVIASLKDRGQLDSVETWRLELAGSSCQCLFSDVFVSAFSGKMRGTPKS